jgi:hypothetical protein
MGMMIIRHKVRATASGAPIFDRHAGVLDTPTIYFLESIDWELNSAVSR